MENNQREKSLGDKLREYREPVDQTALWEGIRPQLPVKRKKSFWPLLLLFFFGAGLGFGINMLTNKYKYNILKSNNKNLTEQIVQLRQSLKTCSFQKTRENALENKKQNAAKTIVKPASSARILSSRVPEVSTKHNNSTSVSPVLQTNNQEYNPEKIVPDQGGLSQEISSLPTHTLQSNHTSSRDIVFSPAYKQPEVVKSPLISYFELVAGPALIMDITSENQKKLISKHQSLFHVQFDAGIQKQIFTKFYANIGMSYQFSASKQAYETTSTENFIFKDTTGIYIGTDGLTQVEMGDVLAKKLITKSGQAYHTRHVVSLRPGIEYEIFRARGRHLSLGFSMAIPLFYHNTGSLVDNQSGKQALRKNQFLKPEWPWSLGLYYQWPMMLKSSIGLLVRVHHDKQKIIFDNKIHARNYWLPQAGMRILF